MLIFWIIVAAFGVVLMGASPPWGIIVAGIAGIMFLGTIFDVMRGRV